MRHHGGDSVQIITDAYAGLSPAGKRVADYVLGHLQDVPYLSVYELAEKAGVSEAAISRFARSVGFDGFRGLKIAVAERMAPYDSVLDLTRQEDDLGQSITRVLTADIQSIKLTLEALDLDVVRSVANKMVRARKILFCGVGTSGIVCTDATVKFLRLDLPVFAYTDAHIAAAAVGFSTREDVVIGVSHSGATQEVVDLLSMAKRRGAYTVGVTTYPRAPLAGYCKAVLKTMTRESPLHRVAITSRMSQHAVIDALFVAVVSLTQPEALRNLGTASSAAESFR